MTPLPDPRSRAAVPSTSRWSSSRRVPSSTRLPLNVAPCPARVSPRSSWRRSFGHGFASWLGPHGAQHAALRAAQRRVDGGEVAAEDLVHGTVHVLDAGSGEEHHVRRALDPAAVFVEGGQRLRQVPPREVDPGQLGGVPDEESLAEGLDLLGVAQVVAEDAHVVGAFEGGRHQAGRVDDGQGGGAGGGLVQDEGIDGVRHAGILSQRWEVAEPASCPRGGAENGARGGVADQQVALGEEVDAGSDGLPGGIPLLRSPRGEGDDPFRLHPVELPSPPRPSRVGGGRPGREPRGRTRWQRRCASRRGSRRRCSGGGARDRSPRRNRRRGCAVP